MTDTEGTDSTSTDSTGNDSAGTEKHDGLGSEGTIPASLAATVGEEGSNFNHEEDPESAPTGDTPAAPEGGAASE